MAGGSPNRLEVSGLCLRLGQTLDALCFGFHAESETRTLTSYELRSTWPKASKALTFSKWARKTQSTVGSYYLSIDFLEVQGVYTAGEATRGALRGQISWKGWLREASRQGCGFAGRFAGLRGCLFHKHLCSHAVESC